MSDMALASVRDGMIELYREGADDDLEEAREWADMNISIARRAERKRIIAKLLELAGEYDDAIIGESEDDTVSELCGARDALYRAANELEDSQ